MGSLKKSLFSSKDMFAAHYAIERMKYLSHQETSDKSLVIARAFEDFNKTADSLTLAYRQLVERSAELLTYPLLLGALEFVSDGLVVSDKANRVVIINTVARSLLGVGNDDVKGNFYWDILDVTRLSPGHPGHYRKKAPSGVEIDIQITPIADNDGKMIGTVGVIRKAVDPDKTAKNLSGVQNSQTLRMNTSSFDLTPILAAVGDIIVDITHRMRSPLGAIQLFAEILKQELEGEKQRVAEDILIGVHSIDVVLSNLLSFAQPIKPDFKKVDLVAVLEESLFFAKPAMKQQKIRLSTGMLTALLTSTRAHW